MGRWRRSKYMRGPVFRTPEGGSLTFTAADFADNPQGGGQPAGQPRAPAPAEPPAPDPRFDFDIEVMDARGQVAGVLPVPGQAPKPASPPPPATQGVSPDMILEGDHWPTNVRGKKMSDVVGALSALESLPRHQPQPQPPYQPPAPTPQVEFTEDDFGAGADPKAFTAKMNQMIDQVASAKNAPLQMSTMLMQSLILGQQAKSSLKYYDVFKDEIEREMGSQPIQVTANPANWVAVHDRLVRDNVMRVADFERNKTPPKPTPQPSERSNGQSMQTVNGGDPQKPKMSMDELAICRATGVTPQEFVFYRDRY